MAAEKGLSDFDHRHRFVTNFLYQTSVPEKFGRVGSTPRLAEWQVGGIWTLQSGAPFTVNLSTDVANNGEPLSAPSQTAESDLQSQQRPENHRAMVQYILLCGARSVHLRQRGTRHRDRAGTR